MTTFKPMATHTTGPRPIGQLVAVATPEMKLIQSHANRVAAADLTVSRLFGAPLNLHCRVANVFFDRVLIQADSAAWAVKARYLSLQIVDTLNRQAGRQRFSACTVKVAVAQSAATSRPVKKRDLSPAARKCLLDFARHSPDEDLKRAAQALARSESKD